MAHELIGSVTVTPAGPVTVEHGTPLDVTVSYSLGEPNPGNPTESSYSLQWEHLSPGAPTTWDVEDDAEEDVEYTKSCTSEILNSVGQHVLSAVAYYQSDAEPPYSEQFEGVEITVNVVRKHESGGE